MKRAYYGARPKALEAVGNGDYYYRWDIREEIVNNMETENAKISYSCREVVIHGYPEYSSCVEAVVRSEYSPEDELSLLNQYNSYHQGVTDNGKAVEDYREYLSFVRSAREIVRSDFQHEEESDIVNSPRINDIVSLIQIMVNTMGLSRSQSLKVKSLYPEWSADGAQVKKGEKYQYNGKLYEVVQDHTTQSNWSPANQSSLWVEVVEDHEGTLEDPVPYNEELNPMWQGMILEEGKYYTQSGVVYKCIRNTGNKVTQNLADLVSGGFVQKIEAWS